MLVIFDLDGVLIDTAELIKTAYRNAGVEPPDDILAQEGTGWLLKACGGNETFAADVHNTKNRSYLNRLILDKFDYLPPWHTARMLQNDPYGDDHIIGVLTGAPIGTMLSLTYTSDEWERFSIQRDGCHTPEKMRVLREYGKVLPQIHKVYIDDQPKPADFPEDWTFIHYTMDLPNSLYEKIIKSEEHS
jgi:hypothetical protein